MAIELEGLRVFITGRVPHRTKYDLEDSVRDGGGKVAGKVTKSVGLFVEGHGPAKAAAERARELGLQIVSGDDLLTLLRDGRLDLTRGEAGDEGFGDVVGDLRAAFDGTPSPESWAAVVAAIDACAPEELENAVAYASGQLERWPRDLRRARWASMMQWECADGGRYLDGDMRVAPTHWVAQMLAGEFSPKHRLIGALTLHGHKTNATKAKNVFKNPELAGSLRALDMGRMNKFTKGLFKTAAQATNLDALESLNYFPRVDGAGALLAASTAMPKLTRLRVRGTVYAQPNGMRADMEGLFEAEWLSQIDTLECSTTITTGWSGSNSALDYLEGASDRLTNLRHLICTDALLGDRLGSWLDPIETLTLHPRGAKTLTKTLAALAERGMPALTEIDVSQVFSAGGRVHSSEWADALKLARRDLEALGANVYVGPDAPAAARKAAGDLLALS